MPEKILVSVKEGKIHGIKMRSTFSGAEFFSFFGIPYGQPTTRHLRFKDPVKVKPWKDIYDATEEKQGCIQYSLLTYEHLGTEDCLFNNIFTPSLPHKNKQFVLKPVIVNIHPGAYGFGSPHTKFYGSPEFIMHNDIVYVGISYRLHILGFLNLGLKECSGNQGIKDIILSLQWIKENISSFGGDPENITLLGSSSGATLINILMLSPAVKGLFHKVVLMGAYIQNPVAPHQETNEEHARETAINLGYERDLQDNKKILSFLKTQEPKLLIEMMRLCQKNLQKDMAPIVPFCVYNPTLDKTGVLPDLPKNLIKSMSRVPLMIGFSQNESVMGFLRATKALTVKHFKGSFRQNRFGWGYHLNDDDVELINKEVEAFYMNGKPVQEAPLPIKIDIQTDILLSDVYDSVINPLSTDLPTSVFIYKFEFEGNLISMNSTLKDYLDESVKGTFHANDFGYWNSFGEPEDHEAREMIEVFTKLITTFARTGDPNYEGFPVRWTPSTPENPSYLSINKSLNMVQGKLNNDRLQFWDNIKHRFDRNQ